MLFTQSTTLRFIRLRNTPYRKWPRWPAYFIPLAYFPAGSSITSTRHIKSTGAVVRVAPNEVIFTSSQAWNDIYNVWHGEPEMSNDTLLYQSLGRAPTIAEAGHDLHRRYRYLLSKGFSEVALLEQESVTQHKINVLIKQLHAEAANGVAPGMTSWFTVGYLSLLLRGRHSYRTTRRSLKQSEEGLMHRRRAYCKTICLLPGS